VAVHLQLFICSCSSAAVHLWLLICGCLSELFRSFFCEVINQLVLYKVHNGKDQDLMAALDKYLGNSNHKDDDDVQDDEEFHDFVLLKFEP